MDAEIVRQGSALERVYEEWDDLAVAAARPYCAPAWMLAWWRHAAPSGAELRTVVARAAGELVAIAPYFADRANGLSRWRPLGVGASHRLEPLARAGLEEEAAASFGRALADDHLTPDILILDGIPADSPWPRLLASCWPDGRAWMHLDRTTPAPTLALRGHTYDAWLASKSSNFRQQMRRLRRQLAERGGSSRLVADDEDLDRALHTFASLHHGRWSYRGGSLALDDQIEAMLADVAHALPESRFRLWSTEVDGATISSHLFLAAGGEVAYWLGGFDEGWAAQKPAMQTILAAIEHALEHGDTRLDLGPGGQEYKYRLSDGEDVLQTVTLVPRGARYRRARATLLPQHALRTITSRIPEARRLALKQLLRGQSTPR